MSKREDLTGKKFCRLRVLGFSHTKARKSYWECKCSCGKFSTVRSDCLKSGETTSCGCAQRERAGEYVKHGGTGTPEYKCWQKMRERCNNPNDKNYKNYGGRGIEITSRWDDFKLFYSDMGRRPSDIYSIDRINNEEGYEPSNCRWATKKEQANNRRSNVLLTHKGRTQNINQWREELGFSNMLIQNRLKKGWSVEKTLKTPVLKRKRDFKNTLWES